MYVLKRGNSEEYHASPNNFRFEDKRGKYRKILFTSKSFRSQIKTSAYSSAVWFSPKGNKVMFWRVI